MIFMDWLDLDYLDLQGYWVDFYFTSMILTRNLRYFRSVLRLSCLKISVASADSTFDYSTVGNSLDFGCRDFVG